MKGKIHSIETFGTVDGPNIRYVIFTQGCLLRCGYCHNPDTWDCKHGQERTTSELLDDILKYKRYIDGITISGGEPMLQLDFVVDLFRKVKENGLTTVLDTSGCVFDIRNQNLLDKIDEMLKVCDLVMLDIKHIDNTKHLELTGKTNKNILDFAKYLDSKNQKMWLRYVLVPGFNSDTQTLIEWKNFADSLNNVEKIELLPYHTMGKQKYKQLGIQYRFENVKEPSREDILNARKILGI